MASDPPSPASDVERRLGRLRPVALALVLLAAAGWEIRARDAFAGAGEGSDGGPSVSFDSLPLAFGDWIARDVECPPSAVALLNPSDVLSREYRNHRTGESVSLLLVRCADARDLMGHYPPNCYPAHGRAQLSESPKDWTVDDGRSRVTVPGVRYRFAGSSRMSVTDIVVDNFLVLPNGELGRRNEDLVASSRVLATRLRGAGQVQVVTSGGMSDARRDEVFCTFVGPALQVLGGRRPEGPDHE